MLGRGLESLIPNKSQKIEKPVVKEANDQTLVSDKKTFGEEPAPGEAIFQIEIDRIKINPFQPRRVFDPEALKELAASIREYGILQPLIVSKIEKETERGTDIEYQLVAGERRWQASKLLGLPRVPAIVRSIPEERQKLELALVENIQRKNLDPIEEARAYARLQDNFGLTQREIASRLGKSRETIANNLRLLSLPVYVQNALSENKLSESQARLLLSIDDQAGQEKTFQEILANNTSVRELKSRLGASGKSKKIINIPKTPAFNGLASAPVVADPEILALQDNLERLLGSKIKIEKQNQTGELAVVFASLDDFQALLKKVFD